MEPVKKLLLGIHSHQPVGNFPWVVKEGIKKAYLPFLKVLREFPKVKILVHISGPLFGYLERLAPEVLVILKERVDCCQVELLGGPFYEAILPILPLRDQKEQIQRMTRYLEDHFGFTPVGAWIPERVWEPSMASLFVDSGIEAVFLDDSHFLAGGLETSQLGGYFLTEDKGKVLKVFPINKPLRYLIPFKPMEKIQRFFKENPQGLLAMVDDGEKFGIWPGTYPWVYEKGWLRDFFSFLSEGSMIKTVSLTEALKEKPQGWVYLPTTSYEEMEEWTLPPHRQIKVHALKEKVDPTFIRGGFFRNFFSRYPESQRLYRRLLSVGEKLTPEEPAYTTYLEAQCNDAYWHGLFGGLYLPHLRHALWERVIEVFKEKPTEDPYLLKNTYWGIFLSPKGFVEDLFDLEGNHNWAATVGRRLEGYHLQALEKGKKEGEGISTIHEMVPVLTEKEKSQLVEDDLPLNILEDHFLETWDPQATLEKRKIIGEEIPVTWKKVKEGTFQMEASGRLLLKTYRLLGRRWVVSYFWETLPLGNHHLILLPLFILDGTFQVDGKPYSIKKAYTDKGQKFSLQDRVTHRSLTLQCPLPVQWLSAPLETLCLSERGFEKIRQAYWFALALPQEKSFEIHVMVGGFHVGSTP